VGDVLLLQFIDGRYQFVAIYWLHQVIQSTKVKSLNRILIVAGSENNKKGQLA
jgi:hypothetical protein